MTPWNLVVLGSGSAKPTAFRSPSAQALYVGRQVYLIDCGEGTQMQLCKAALAPERVVAVFITHLHADHTLGLFGLIASLSMSGRTAPLAIYAHRDLKPILDTMVAFFVVHLNFELQFHPLPDTPGATIYADRQLSVSTIPLHHRIPTMGFKFEEHPLPPNIYPEVIEKYALTRQEIATLKRGEDVLLENGDVLSTTEALYQRRNPRSFAYMSDTLYTAAAAEYVEGVDLLYHEATYMQALIQLAKDTGHSTAQQAATFAKLANVKQLLLGHYSARYTDPTPLLQEAVAVFPNTTLARELDVHKI